jgi:hypothetical protein
MPASTMSASNTLITRPVSGETTAGTSRSAMTRNVPPSHRKARRQYLIDATMVGFPQWCVRPGGHAGPTSGPSGCLHGYSPGSSGP